MSEPTPAAPPPEPRWAVPVRAAVAAVISAYLLLGPAVAQIGGHRLPALPEWVMFAGFGLQVCKVRYARVHEDGGQTPLDRFRLLGFEGRLDAPRSVWRVPDAETALQIGQRLCRATGDPDPDVRVWASCAQRSGWKHAHQGDHNVCGAGVRR